MRRFIAGTMTLAVAAATVSTAAGQATKTAPPQRPAGAVATPKASASPKAGTPAKAAPAPPLTPEQLEAKRADDAKKRQEMDALLSDWEMQSKKVTSLMVVFERIDKSVKWGDQVYEGKAILKSPDLACLEFKKAIPDANGKPKYADVKGVKVLEVEKNPFQRIVCTGKDVLQFEWDEQAIYIYPLDKEARQKALQQGPLPFLFNMKAAEAKARYGMTLLNQDHYPDDYLIAIVPREEIDKESFQRAFVYLNKKSFLPSQVVLYPIGDKDMQHFRFTNIQPNQPIDDAYFRPSTNIPKWRVIRNDPQVSGAPKPGAVPSTAAPGTAASPKRVTAQPPSRGAGRN